ncbi:putative glycoside hydrolase [Aquabacterium sp.]|uniref:putative glycoside hydrolase n=1 Tax=Aquabacterium sp. TaxID=1872578 RepID=UPI00378446DA
MKPALRRLCLLAWLLAAGGAGAVEGQVLDARSGTPVAGAWLSSAGHTVRSDAKGRFDLPLPPDAAPPAPAAIAVRAPGYWRQQLAPPAGDGPLPIALQPVAPKALYLSAWGIGDVRLRGEALALIARSELDALVIDVKGDSGVVPFRSSAHAQAGLGPQAPITVADMPALMAQLRGRGLYLIARIVVFKDDGLAAAHPQWAVRDAQGRRWRDREGLSWIDPFEVQAWQYSLALAEEAAALGFDEIQFDYLRFPDAAGLQFSQADEPGTRVAAIAGYLDAARERLARYNVLLAADVFGYICWNEDDTGIGQQLEALVPHVDVLSPMLYPSGFSFGIPGHRQPVAAPREIVQLSLQRALDRTGVAPRRLRPWLQAFRDYAFDHRVFGAAEIRAQIDAAEGLGTAGWMLWNAANHYGDDGLKPRAQPPAASAPP